MGTYDSSAQCRARRNDNLLVKNILDFEDCFCRIKENGREYFE